MMKYQVPAWDTANKFACYKKNGVNFAKEFCEHMFASQDADDEGASEKLQACFASQGAPKGTEFCDK